MPHLRPRLIPLALFFALSFAEISRGEDRRAALPPTAAKHVKVSDFGAVGDGRELSTAAIQQAIDQTAGLGGGVVEIPAGQFRSGSIFLRQGVELYLAAGAVLLGSNNIEDYPKRPTRIEGHTEPWRMALVNAQNLAHVRITGPGKLDGNGILFWAAFWQRRKENPRCTNLEVERPRLMFVDRCQDVQVSGISLQDSGFWNIHLYNCQDVLLDGLRITAPTTGHILGPSTDGVDVDSCQGVTIRHCYIAVNDDNIALKGSKGPHADQDPDSPPVENILVEDCEFGDGNGLITCGSEATIVRNVIARNCVVSGRTTLLTLKLRPDTPQRYENILIDSIKVHGTGRILNIAPWTQFFDLKGEAPPSSVVKGIVLRNITGEYRAMGTIAAHEHARIEDLTLENFQLTVADDRLATGQVEQLHVKNVKINGREFVPGSKPIAVP